MACESRECIFFGYGRCGKMGFKLWGLEAREILCRNDMYFTEGKMHKRPLKIVEVYRFVFQKHRQVQNG